MWCMTEELKHLTDWFSANKLTLNLNKSVCMLFCERDPKVNFYIKVDDIVLPKVDCTKFLGVWIDSKLKWKTHIDKLLIKLKQNMNLLKVGKNFMNIHCKKLVYYGHIQSHIAYCISIWGNIAANSLLARLNQLLMKCAKLISKQKNCQTLGILLVPDLIKLENLKFGYKLIHNELPLEIENCTKHDHQGISLIKSHSYNTRNKNLPNIPSSKNTKYLSSVFCKGSLAFMRLPIKIKNIKHYATFVKESKKLLLTKIS